MRFTVHSRRSAYVALVLLTLIWGFNWIAMKFALESANPVVLNVQRIWLAVVVLFAVLIGQRRPFFPSSWVAVIVTGLFQTTLNSGSTTMALAGGGAGRTSVLVFTMPFWTLLIAWPVLNERVKGSQWLARGSRDHGPRARRRAMALGGRSRAETVGGGLGVSAGPQERSRPNTSSGGTLSIR